MNPLTLVKPALKGVKKFGVQNASHLLMGAGTGCSIAAVISGVKLSPGAERALREARFKKKGKLTVWEWIKVVARYYGPAVALEILALFCFWGAHWTDIHRQTVLAGICAGMEETIREYQKKVQELIGPEGEKEVSNAIAQDRVDALPPPQSTYILDSSTDRQFVYVCYDGSVQRFMSNYNKLKESQNLANKEMIDNQYLSETELMWLLDPEKKWLRPVYGSGDVGWTIDDLMYLTLDWADGPDHQPIGTIKITDKDGIPYHPKPGFSKMF